jgi:hypothetical protein
MPESYLENALQKLARQLVAFDEASLMDLWEKYAEAVRQFEPTRRWEESVLIFGLIQAVRMKNQLFNHNLAASRQPAPTGAELGMLDLTAPPPPQGGAQAQPQPRRQERPEAARTPLRGSVRQGKPKAGKLIPLRPGKD